MSTSNHQLTKPSLTKRFTSLFKRNPNRNNTKPKHQSRIVYLLHQPDANAPLAVPAERSRVFLSHDRAVAAARHAWQINQYELYGSRHSFAESRDDDGEVRFGKVWWMTDNEDGTKERASVMIWVERCTVEDVSLA